MVQDAVTCCLISWLVQKYFEIEFSGILIKLDHTSNGKIYFRRKYDVMKL